MSRPPERSGAVVAVSIDGKGAAWCDGTFQGDRDIVTYAKRAAAVGQPVKIHHTTVDAGDTTALAATAALAAYAPGRTLIAEAPPEVYAALYPDEENPAATWGVPGDTQEGD